MNLIPPTAREIRLVAMRRSGSHALLNWLASLFEGRVCFLNDVSRKPTLRQDQACEVLPCLAGGRGVPLNRSKSLLIYNYEDADLSQLKDHAIPQEWRGHPQHSHTILLLRDPWNLYASRVALRQRMPDNPFTHELAPHDLGQQAILRNLWVQHAMEFTEASSLLGPDLIRVRYDRWLLEPDYRMEICTAVGGTYTEEALDQVPEYGFGSSFPPRPGSEAGPDRAALLERWKPFAGEALYEAFAGDPEVITWGRRIFGQGFVP
jgi:hypothetical protein